MNSFALPLLLVASVGIAGISVSAAPETPITQVVPELDQIHKWDTSQGDTWDPFWTNDDTLYSFNCDGRGFGMKSGNLCFNKFDGTSFPALTGESVNAMEEFGQANKKEADGATWKVCGGECIDGVFYGFVARNTYGNESKDPLMRQTSFNSSLIKSTDQGHTWTHTAKENYDKPMWPGGRFGSPGFFHFGKNGGNVTQDGADKYVYAISNNGFWNGGDNFIVGRVSRVDLPKLDASKWTYFTGGDGANDASWSPDITQAKPVLDRPAKCGWTSPAYIPALHRYLLVSWYVTPTLKSWFDPGEVDYDFYEAGHPTGPWTAVGSLNDKFLPTGSHMYGPNICPKFQETVKGGVQVIMFTSGCPFEDQPTGLYKAWAIPLLLKTTAPESTQYVNDDDKSISYDGEWTAAARRGNHGVNDDAHFTNKPGASATLTFAGTGVDVISEKYKDMGQMDVYLDGKLEETADLATTNFPRVSNVAIYRSGELNPGTHTIKVVNKTAATGLIDAFRVYGG